MKKLFICLFICLILFNTVKAEELEIEEVSEVLEVQEKEVSEVLEVEEKEVQEDQKQVEIGVIDTSNVDSLKYSIDQLSNTINSIELKQQEQQELRSVVDSESIQSYSYCSDSFYNYIPLDYIHFTGLNSYFVLDQLYNFDYTFETSFRSSIYNSRFIFGSYFYDSDDSLLGYYGVGLANSTTSYAMFSSIWKQYSVSNSSSSFHDIYLNNSSYTQDGITNTFSSVDRDFSSAVNSLNIPVGARSNHDYYDQFFIGDIRYFKIYDSDGNLVVDLVPVKRITDSIPGFYDKVNCKFYTASGLTDPIESHNHFAINIFNTFINLFQTLLTTSLSIELLEWFIVVFIFSFFIYLFSRS